MSTRIFDRINVDGVDLIDTAHALSVFGFQPTSTEAEQIILQVDGGGIRVDLHQRTLPAGSGRAAFYGLDVYSSHADLSGRLAAAAGWQVNAPVPYWTGGHPIIESRCLHPRSGVTVFAAQTPPELAIPTVLDNEPGRLHSDIVTAVWFIDEADVDAEVAFWTQQIGLTQFESTTWYDAQSQGSMFQLDKPQRIGGAMFIDEYGLQVLEVLFLEGGGLLDTQAGRSSLHSVSFERKSIGVESGARPLGRAIGGTSEFYESPAGVVFEHRA